MDQKRVLCVGLCCLDIVSLIKDYPAEDSDQRCLDCWRQRGGNASNNCTVLSQLGTKCEYLGSLANTDELSFLQKDFAKYGIDTSHCVLHEGCVQPISSVWLNATNGSRTIVHYTKNLPELTTDDFNKLNLDDYSWIHFEDRPNFSDICHMINQIRKWNDYNNDKNTAITISVEIEKCRESSEELLDKGDVVFISKDFAAYLGYGDMKSAVCGLITRVRKRAILVCAWGEKGACAMVEGTSRPFQSHAFPPANLVNSLGAGDAFNAAMIHALTNGRELPSAITFACQLAGLKCGILKWNELESTSTNLLACN